MKKTILLAMLTSLPLWAISEDALELYQPTEALKDINAGKLNFLGRALFPGNDQNYTCVYKNDYAYVLYNNCMANKKESSATDIEVISFNGDIASFYIQNKTFAVPVSATPRAEYNMTWRVSVTASPAVSNKLTIADLKKYKESYSPSSAGCFIGSTFKAQDMNAKVLCLGGIDNPAWKSAAESFWIEPSEEWYQTLKYLRKVITETKF